MDYLKLIALALSPAIAVYAILVTYKTKTRTGDPTSERDVLTRAGKFALVLVLIAGMFSLLSEWSNQRKKQAEKNMEAQQVVERLNRLQKAQEALGLNSGQILRKTEEGLLLLRQCQGGSDSNSQQRQAVRSSK
jgi:hypothetical protein